MTRRAYVPSEEILEEVKHFLKEEHLSIDYLSLSGSGEPTLHSQIGSIIEGIKAITSIPVTVITNGSLLNLEEVRIDLLHADVILPSLDAVSSEVFSKINRPVEGLSVEAVMEGLVQFRSIYKGRIWLEILFCKGVNNGEDELLRMKETIARIKPDWIHINTVVRPPSEKWVTPLSQEELEKIKGFLGDKTSIISEFDRHHLHPAEGDIKQMILKILRRRPLSFSDLSKGMGMRKDELDEYLVPLLQEGMIQSRRIGNSIYFEILNRKDLSF